jgi:quercetin dioxygenase-like cupin family protein
VVDQEAFDNQLKSDRFPFSSKGDISLAVRNANCTLSPIMLHVTMKPGATIPAHIHKGMAEALYVADGGLK